MPTKRRGEPYDRAITLAIKKAIRERVWLAIRRENRSCRLIAVAMTWQADKMRDRHRARITHQVAKDIAEAIGRRHGKEGP